MHDCCVKIIYISACRVISKNLKKMCHDVIHICAKDPQTSINQILINSEFAGNHLGFHLDVHLTEWLTHVICDSGLLLLCVDAMFFINFWNTMQLLHWNKITNETKWSDTNTYHQLRKKLWQQLTMEIGVTLSINYYVFWLNIYNHRAE